MTVTTSLPGNREAARRSAVLEGLAAFAAFLAARPDLPLGAADPFLYTAKGGADEQNRAEVDRIAAILGVTAGDSPIGTHYAAARDFGGGVTYSAWTFTVRRRPSPLCPAGPDMLGRLHDMAWPRASRAGAACRNGTRKRDTGALERSVMDIDPRSWPYGNEAPRLRYSQ